MIWFGLAILLMVIGCVLVEMGGNSKDGGASVASVGTVVFFIVLVTTMFTTFGCLGAIHGIDECDRNIEIATKQYEQQMAVIKNAIKDYPLESELLKDLDPVILLKLPEIKSNEVLVATVKLATEYRNKIFEFEYRKSKYLKRVAIYQHWLIIPKFCRAKI